MCKSYFESSNKQNKNKKKHTEAEDQLVQAVQRKLYQMSKRGSPPILEV